MGGRILYTELCASSAPNAEKGAPFWSPILLTMSMTVVTMAMRSCTTNDNLRDVALRRSTLASILEMGRASTGETRRSSRYTVAKSRSSGPSARDRLVVSGSDANIGP